MKEHRRLDASFVNEGGESEIETNEKGSRQIAGEAEARIQSAAGLDTALVKRVIDADTIEVEFNGIIVDVRLLLIDAPETVHPNIPDEALGAEAVARARQILLGKQVQLEYDGPKYDNYGRLLAYLWVDGVMLNELLLEEGLAHVAYVYHPPYKHYQRYVQAQMRAKDGWKGIWGRGGLSW